MGKALLILPLLVFACSFLFRNGKIHEVYQNTVSSVKGAVNRETWKIAAIATVFFMLVSYLYFYMNGSFIGDNGFVYRGDWSISDMRVTGPHWFGYLLNFLDLGINVPWFSGLQAIFFMTISVCCIADVFALQRKVSIWIVAGLCATQHAIVNMHTFRGGLDKYGTFALMFACLSVWMLEKQPFRKITTTCAALVMMVISMSSYASFAGMISSLLILILVSDILECRVDRHHIYHKTAYFFCSFLGGLVCNYALWRLLMSLTHGTVMERMGWAEVSTVGGALGRFIQIPEAYQSFFLYYLGQHDWLPRLVVHIQRSLFVFGVIIACFYITSGIRNNLKNRGCPVLLVLAALVFPLSVNLMYALAGWVHTTMVFPYVSVFLFLVKAADHCVINRATSPAPARLWKPFVAFCGVFLFYSVLFADVSALYLHNGYQVAWAIGNRILSRIETCDGFDGTEDVVMVGNLHFDDYFARDAKEWPEIQTVAMAQGMGRAWPNLMGIYSAPQHFLYEVMDSRLSYTGYDTLEGYTQDVDPAADVITQLKNMAHFPREGSVKKIGNTIYVRFADRVAE